MTSSIVRVWQAEGTLAVRDRLLDRLEDARWREASWLSGSQPWPSTPIVNVSGVPLTAQYGGVPLQLRARLAREAKDRPVALLSREIDGSLRFDAWNNAGRWHRVTTFPRGAWNGDPLVDDPHWLDTIHTCCRLVRARAVHVENPAGLSLAALARLADPDQCLPVVLSVHDFSLFCRRPHLWDARGGRFCEYSTDAPRCHACLSAGGDGFTIDQAAHRAAAATLLASAVAIVVPSAFMGAQLATLFPASCDPRKVHIIEPGIASRSPALARPSARVAKRVAFIGGAQDHKSGARLPALAAMLGARGVTVTIYGGYGHEHLLALRKVRRVRLKVDPIVPPRLEVLVDVRVRGYYCARTLPALLARDETAVALALSGVPESFSLVLSEAWAAGVPVVAPDLGAFSDRLAHGGGQLVSAYPSDAEIIDAIEHQRHKEYISIPAVPTVQEAAAAHLACYRTCRLMTSS